MEMKIKRYIVIALLGMFFPLQLLAQDVAVFFTSMPLDLMPSVEKNRRKDLIDLYNDNRTAVIQNSFNTGVRIQKMTDDYILMQSDRNSFEIILLSLINESKMICTIQTVCAPVCDSKISFYTTDWKPLDASNFITIADASSFVKDDIELDDEAFLAAKAALDMDLMELHINPQDQTLIQTYNTPSYLSEDAYQKIQPYLKEEPKVYHWNKLQFKQH